MSCSLNAGSLIDTNSCLDTMINAGTSNTQQHENTSVIILDFELKLFKKNQKSILKLISSELNGKLDTNP